MASIPKQKPPQLLEVVRLQLERRLFDAQGQAATDAEADETLASLATYVLRGTFRGRRNKGLSGWHVGKHRNAKFRHELVKHLQEANSADVMRVAAIILMREQLHGPDA